MFNPAMFANLTPEQVKAQQEQLNKMSDEDLQKQINSAKAFMPGKATSIVIVNRYA